MENVTNKQAKFGKAMETSSTGNKAKRTLTTHLQITFCKSTRRHINGNTCKYGAGFEKGHTELQLRGITIAPIP